MRKSKQAKWVFSVVAAVALLAIGPAAFAQVGLKGFGKTVVIDVFPDRVSASVVAIQQGATVIWANASDNNLTLNFSSGKEVEKACRAPTGFKLVRGAYQAANIPPGGVASLCFVERGAYHYTVSPAGGPVGENPPGTGTVTVRRG